MLLLQSILLQDKTVCTSNKLSETQKKTLNQVLAEFSSTCKRYTDVMALKYLLQCHVFNHELAAEMASNLGELIINLQTAAIKLQKMEVSYCKFSSTVSKLVLLIYQCSRR